MAKTEFEKLEEKHQALEARVEALEQFVREVASGVSKVLHRE